MQLVKGADSLPIKKPLVLGLGNFDGVHLGHQSLINRAITRARELEGTAGVLVFDPHPLKVLAPHRFPKLLTATREKARLMAELGLDVLIIEDFTLEVASMSPESFVDEVLVKKLGVAAVFIGYNYSFGHKAQGDPALMEKLGREKGFEVHVIPPVTVGQEVVSSSLVRKHLEQGNIEEVKKYLGRWPRLAGRVVKGEKRGRGLGFPTANLEIDEDLMIPGRGVYAAKAEIEDRVLKAVVNIGRKPTFHENFPLSVEVHLLEFNQDIYGMKMEIEFLRLLRGEKRFLNAKELVRQIEQDISEARSFLSQAE